MTKNVAVVGAGIIGLCTALQLAKRGFTVTLFDKHGAGNKCSFGNAGHFATEQVFPLANISLLPKLPKMLLDPNGPLRIHLPYLFKALPWFIRFLFNMRQSKQTELTAALRALNEPSIAAYKRLLDVAYDVFISNKGSLLTFEHADLKTVKKLHQHYASQGIAVELLEGTEVHQLEPALSHKVKRALYFTDVAHSANPHKLCTFLLSEVQQLGGALVQEHVDNLTQTEHGVVLTTSNTKRVFDHVVLASGVWSKTLAKQLSYHVPIDAERGYHTMLDTPNPITRPVASADRQFIITPMSQGLRLAGTVEFAGVDAKENHHRATMLVKHAAALIPRTMGKPVTSTWMGCRPSLPDSLPVIGRSPKHDNIYFAFGHQHLGLTQGAITSELIADLIQGKEPSITLTPYRIDRF